MDLYKNALKVLLTSITEENLGDKVFRYELIQMVKADKELFEFFLSNTKVSNIKNLLIDYRKNYPNNEDFSLEQDLAMHYLQEYKTKYANEYTRDILRMIPDYLFLEDKKWVSEMFKTNSFVYEYIDEDILRKLGKTDWFADILLESHSLNIKNFANYISLDEEERMWRFISHDLTSFAQLPFPEKMNNYVINNIWEKLESNDVIFKDWGKRIDTIQNLTTSIEKYDELFKCGKIKDVNNKAELISIENYKDRIIHFGGYYESMSDEQRIISLENRKKIFDDEDFSHLIQNPVLTFLTKGLTDESLVGSHYYYSLVKYYNKLSTDLKIDSLSIRDCDKEVIKYIIINKKNDNSQYKQLLERFNNEAFEHGLSQKSFNSIFFSISKELEVFLLEEVMLKEMPSQKIKVKALKF